MKKKATIYTIVSAFIIFSAFKIADNIIEKLGMEEKTARSYILANFVGRHETGPMDENGMPESFEIPYMKVLPSMYCEESKQKLLLNSCTYIKTYVNSEEFIIDYKTVKKMPCH